MTANMIIFFTFLNILGPPLACLSIRIQPSDIPLLNPIFELSPSESFCKDKNEEKCQFSMKKSNLHSHLLLYIYQLN